MSTKEASLYLDTDGDIESMEEEQVQWYRFDQDGPDGEMAGAADERFIRSSQRIQQKKILISVY